MSLNGQQFEKKQKPVPPQGPQVAICYSIIDLGRHSVSFQGQPAKETPLVHFSWELPNLPKVSFQEGKEPQPYAVFQEYTVSLGEKSKLQKLLSSWRGVPPTDLAKDLPMFLGQSCLINIEYKNDKQKPEIHYANISMNGLGVMRLPQGTQVAPLTNPKMFFNLDNYSHTEFVKLPTFIQKKIMSSLDWSGIVTKFGTPPVQPTANTNTNTQPWNNPQNTPPVNQNNGFNQTPVNQPASNVGFGGEIVTGNPFDNTKAPF